MNIFLLVIAALVAIPFLLYFFAPRFLFNIARGALRRKAGLIQKMAMVGGINWPYLEGGNANGKPLVLIHGFGGDKDNWSFYAPFAKDEYRLIFPDLPGFGENDRNINADHSIGAQVLRLKEFLDTLGIEKCHLGGNSMGGAIALQFALDYPERLRSLTLFNNAGVMGTDESELQQLIQQGESPLVPKSLADIDRLMAFISHKPRYVPHQFKKLMYNEMKPHEQLLDKIFNQIAQEALDSPLNDRLKDVSVPTDIIWGRQDRLLDVSCAIVQHEAIPDSELMIFEEVGHIPMVENPAATAKHHLAFLAKH